MNTPALILGCGYTGERIARRLVERGVEVIATTRDAARRPVLDALGVGARVLDATRPEAIDVFVGSLPERLRVAHSIPPAGTIPALLAALRDRMERLVYISSTGIYGATRAVDAETPPAPVTPMQAARREAEVEVLRCGVPALVLRAPAIYGPGRGVHVAMRAGRFKLVGDGRNLVSRIHVDDLAAHVVAGLYADATGAWPVADERSATSLEVATWCAEVTGAPMPPRVAAEEVHETRRVTRAVDGSAIRDRLGVSLRYPTYREGIAAALAAEQDRAEDVDAPS